MVGKQPRYLFAERGRSVMLSPRGLDARACSVIMVCLIGKWGAKLTVSENLSMTPQGKRIKSAGSI